MRSCLLALLVLAGGCGTREKQEEAVSDVAAAWSSDSLALTAPDGTEIWFRGARPAADTNGITCVERSMEIRRGGQHIAIPLLYTGSLPRLVNDSTIEAAIWLNCRPGNVYQVNLRTGQPTRVR